MTKMYVRAEELRPSGAYTSSPMTKLFIVDIGINETGDSAIARARNIAVNANCDPTNIMMHSGFEPHEKREWLEVFPQKLGSDKPDWYAWSKLMATEPIPY